MTRPDLVIVAPTLADAATIARRRVLPDDRWLWAASESVAARWVERAAERGVALRTMPVWTPGVLVARRSQ